MTTSQWLERVIQMASENAANGEGPFAAIVVRDNEIVGRGVNCIGATQDPTAHAELLAIQDACKNLNRVDLSDCILYASGEPCPMCMGAIYWARPQAVYYACSKAEAAAEVGMDDPLHDFYHEMQELPEKRMIPMHRLEAEGKLEPFIIWLKNR